ncbi:unnamed protein product [Cuscuta europaea]|uniref:RNase H type-1 domain-containing protein n=1 Tax=Cuscuta europaea TaxID=41803 RepID=A0A9P0ZNS5_CUSEU|nr:unnamed protein product [Cuscuta europaea]
MTELGRIINDYFNNIFSSVHSNENFLFHCVPRKLDEFHNVELLRPIRGEEVKAAIFSMYPDKAPGPDGMSPRFFQHFWDVVGPDFIKFCADAFQSGWEQAQQTAIALANQGSTCTSLWRRPLQGRVKLNVDAAVRDYHCGLGWILRNEEGVFVAGAAKSWRGKLSPLEAELVGIREALSWVKEQGWERVDVELDAARAIAEIKNGSCISSAGVIAEDVRDLCSRMMDISFCFIRRSANRAAHGFAQVACSMSGCRIWIGDPPNFITHVLNSDLITIN